MIKSRVLAAFAAGASLLVVTACGGSDGASSSEEFPSDDVNMIISYAAGGPTDVGGRAIAAFMEKDLGTTFVVENKEGASGSVGTADVVRSEPDGYTIGMTTASAAGRVPLIEDVGYDLEDVQAIGVGTFGPGLIVVGADSGYSSIDDLIEEAKANPGGIKVGTAGASSPQHVELVRMADEYDVEFTAVPFQGEAPAVTALLGDNIDACFCSNAQTTMAQVDAGEFTILATGAPDRLGWVPDVPTLAESGFESLIYGNSYFILVAPADIPEGVLSTLEGSLEKALEDPATIEVIGEVRILDEFMGADALQKMMVDEQETLGPILMELLG